MSLSLLSSRESKCSCERQLPRPSAAFRKQPRLTAPASGPTGKATQIVWPEYFSKLLNSYSENVKKIVENVKIKKKSENLGKAIINNLLDFYC